MKNPFLKKILCILLTCLLLLPTLTLMGCNNENPAGENSGSDDSTEATTPGETESETETEAETEDTFVYENNVYQTVDIQESLKIIGRSNVTEDGITADWSGSGIEFHTKSKDSIKFKITADRDVVFKCYVDDLKPYTIQVSAGTRTYTTAYGLEKGEHYIRLLKQSAVESSNAGTLCTIEEIKICGELREKPADKELFVEFIGDSITCGVGSLAENVPNSFGSYAYLFAEEMNVDYSMVCISGIGLLKSTSRHNGLTMLTAYPCTNYYRSRTQTYTPTRQADIVVINLNTNDKGSMEASQKDTYKAQAQALIQSIKAIHGEDVKIVWVFGMMTGYSTGYCDLWATELLKSLGGEEAGYYHIILTTNRAGVSNHPNTAGHQLAAQELATFFREKGLITE